MAFIGIIVSLSASDSGTVKATSAEGLSALGSAVNIADGLKHKVAIVIKTDSAQVFIDGVGGTEDTSGSWSIGALSPAIDIGEGGGGTTRFNGLISNLKIYKKYTAKP